MGLPDIAVPLPGMEVVAAAMHMSDTSAQKISIHLQSSGCLSALTALQGP